LDSLCITSNRFNFGTHLESPVHFLSLSKGDILTLLERDISTLG
jgi:hypothetical protein